MTLLEKMRRTAAKESAAMREHWGMTPQEAIASKRSWLECPSEPKPDFYKRVDERRQKVNQMFAAGMKQSAIADSLGVGLHVVKNDRRMTKGRG